MGGIIGIEATNIKAGGGFKVLQETLNSLIDPRNYGITKVIIYGGERLNEIENREWLEKRIISATDKSFLTNYFYKLYALPKILRRECDLVYVPGGLYPGKKINYVCTSQNMLVFEKEERNRFPISKTWFRYVLLNLIQRKAFRNSIGNIFLTEYSRNIIKEQVKEVEKSSFAIVPHGATTRFRHQPKKQNSIKAYDDNNPFRILYVSIINFYKHQWHIVEAIKLLREKKYPIHLDLIGPAHPPALKKLKKHLIDTEGFITYHGKVPYEVIEQNYQKADMFLFGSTCETMPNILLEAMSAGLPILSSSYGPMKEILGEAGVYMNPLNPIDVVSKLEHFLNNPSFREQCAIKGYEQAKNYTWDKAAIGIYSFLGKMLKEIKN